MNKRIVGYLADWGFHAPLKEEQAQYLTHINYAFGLIKDGEVSIAHLQKLEALADLRKTFPEIRINLSVGGWGAEGFCDAVATSQSREKLAVSAISVMRQMDLDGIDWDWEYPSSDAAGIKCSPLDPQNMTAFLVLMRQKLDGLSLCTGKRYEQSIAVGADSVNDYIWPGAVPVLDTVNLMTYDMSMGDRAGHVTNLMPCAGAAYSASQSAEDFEKAGVPREKILIGAAFYFHAYEGVDEKAPLGSRMEKRGRNIPHDNLGSEWTEKWDEQALAAYYVKENVLMTGDDRRSLIEKRRYIDQQGLGGVIIWELNHDKKNLLLPCLGKGAGADGRTID